MASGRGDEEGSADGAAWRLVGRASELAGTRCRLMYSSLGRGSDVCLFYVKGEFFAMDARCSHSGGPLCEGDIEEADGVLQVFCPWHDYNFDLRTRKSGTSLQNRRCSHCCELRVTSRGSSEGDVTSFLRLQSFSCRPHTHHPLNELRAGHESPLDLKQWQIWAVNNTGTKKAI
ncbi:Rieske domain-containing protein isoform X1 [Betta splendens]|uniref:Rieske domain-containing protein isoform X1 n=1 Tax=Betta splendens TaxID=158456 RepID=A0A6P7MB76_BETSP|nr:Rieske domain-containing protein isoform X1 [Betta splendens]